MKSDFNTLVEQIINEWTLKGAGQSAWKLGSVAAKTAALAAGVPINPLAGGKNVLNTKTSDTSTKPTNIVPQSLTPGANQINSSTVNRIEHTPVPTINNFSQAEAQAFKSKLIELVDMVKTKNLQTTQLTSIINQMLK